MSNQHPIAADSPRRHQLEIPPKTTTHEANIQSDRTPRSHRGSPRRASTSPTPHQTPSFAPAATMPVEILSRPALPLGGHDHLPWQGKHDERLPSVRSLIHLPPLTQPQSLHPPAGAMPTPTPTSISSTPITAPARHSWPLPTPMGPPTHPISAATLLSAIPETHPAHRSNLGPVGPPRPFPPRPRSINAVSPISYTTSPRATTRHEEVALSPDLRVPRRASPPQNVHSHFITRSPGAEAEQQHREAVTTGQGMLKLFSCTSCQTMFSLNDETLTPFDFH